jgi:Ni,Fe-hydrogenase maturation factor
MLCWIKTKIRKHPLRIAILGIGNELNGDDAAGVLAVRAIKNQLAKRAVQADSLGQYSFAAGLQGRSIW